MNRSVHTNCSVCSEDRKSRYREFSSHAWTALVSWGELGGPMIGQAMCDGCYAEFRDLLIERADEVTALAEQVAQNPAFPNIHEMPAFNHLPDAQIAS